MRAFVGSHLLAVLSLLFASNCASRIAVPIQSPKTPPTALLDIFFPQDRTYTVTSAGFNPTLPAQLGGNNEISLVGKCTDGDGGCQNVQILADATASNPDGSAVVIKLSEPGKPVAENPDTTAQPGGTADKERLVSSKLDVRQIRGSFAGLRLDVSGRAINAHQDTDNTKKVTLWWSRQVPLVLPPCADFNPVGTDPPLGVAVLDSRELSVIFQNFKTRDPNKTRITVEVADRRSPNIKNVWDVTSEEAGLPPTAAYFRLANFTGSEKEVLFYDTRAICPLPNSGLKASANSASTELLLDSAGTTGFAFLADKISVAAWNEATFWQAFGGRRNTFAWICPSEAYKDHCEKIYNRPAPP